MSEDYVFSENITDDEKSRKFRGQGHESHDGKGRDDAQEQQAHIGTLGQAEDIANAVAFLVSGKAGYITGETLHVNGGLYMA